LLTCLLTCLSCLSFLLLQRVRRREFILEHGLLSVRRMQGLEKRRMAGERERTAQMRVFARCAYAAYLSPEGVDICA
jgi:hypothetical protein